MPESVLVLIVGICHSLNSPHDSQCFFKAYLSSCSVSFLNFNSNIYCLRAIFMAKVPNWFPPLSFFGSQIPLIFDISSIVYFSAFEISWGYFSKFSFCSIFLFEEKIATHSNHYPFHTEKNLSRKHICVILFCLFAFYLFETVYHVMWVMTGNFYFWLVMTGNLYFMMWLLQVV